MTVVLLKILQVILALSILIIIHEAGHFMWAKLFHIRVDKFFLFFDAGGVKLFSTKAPWFVKLVPAAAGWETEYGIGWLPLGGYCKIAGMIDESMDTESLKQDPQPWEFRTKPAWQRLLVMAGGVLNNFILAILLFILILSIWGTAYVSRDNPVYVNEHPIFFDCERTDKLYIFYSASASWTDFSCIGELSADKDSDILDPASWSKAPEPVFREDRINHILGPSVPCLIPSPDGKEWFLVYSASDQNNLFSDRDICLQQISFSPKGHPLFGRPVPWGEQQVKPSRLPPGLPD